MSLVQCGVWVFSLSLWILVSTANGQLPQTPQTSLEFPCDFAPLPELLIASKQSFHCQTRSLGFQTSFWDVPLNALGTAVPQLGRLLGRSKSSDVSVLP